MKTAGCASRPANALKNMGDTAKPVIPDMLKAVAKTAEPLQPVVWDDPIQLTHGELAAALFQGLLRSSVKGVDPELLYPAIRAISRNADGMARAQLTHTIGDLLTLEDVQALAPDILAAIKQKAPADTMFGNEIRMGGFKALTKYHFKEGIEAGVDFRENPGRPRQRKQDRGNHEGDRELWLGRPRSSAGAEGIDRGPERPMQAGGISRRRTQ